MKRAIWVSLILLLVFGFATVGYGETESNNQLSKEVRDLILKLGNDETRDAAEFRLLFIGRRRALPILEKSLEDENRKIRLNSAKAIYYYTGEIVKYRNADNILVAYQPDKWDKENHWPRFCEGKIDGKVYIISITYGIGATTRIYKIVDAELAFEAAKRNLRELLNRIEQEEKVWAYINIGIPNTLKVMEAASLKNKERITYLEYQNAILSKKNPETIKKALENWNKAKKEYETFLENSWYVD